MTARQWLVADVIAGIAMVVAIVVFGGFTVLPFAIFGGVAHGAWTYWMYIKRKGRGPLSPEQQALSRRQKRAGAEAVSVMVLVIGFAFAGLLAFSASWVWAVMTLAASFLVSMGLRFLAK